MNSACSNIPNVYPPGLSYSAGMKIIFYKWADICQAVTLFDRPSLVVGLTCSYIAK